MNEFLRRNPLLAALAGAAVLLAVALALEIAFVRPTVDAGGGRKAAPAEAKLLPPLAAFAPEQAYPETATRPLFTPTRRPAPEPAAQQQAAFQPGQYVLLGVTMAGDNRIAMLREKSTGRIYRIARGGEINGIKLAAIERDTVTLAMGGQQEQLPLVVQKAGAPGAPGAHAATPGGPGHPNPNATLQGPFGAGAASPATPARPGAPVPLPSGFTGVPAAQGGAPGAVPVPAPPQGMAPTVAFPGAAPVPSATPNPSTDPNAGLSPEEILARRRARRAQTSQ